MQIFYVYRPYKESISKEMNHDNDLNLHSMTKLPGWLHYWFSDFPRGGGGGAFPGGGEVVYNQTGWST